MTIIRYEIPKGICHRDRGNWRQAAETSGIRFDADPKPVAIFDYVSGQYVILQEVEDGGESGGDIPSG